MLLFYLSRLSRYNKICDKTYDNIYNKYYCYNKMKFNNTNKFNIRNIKKKIN